MASLLMLCSGSAAFAECPAPKLIDPAGRPSADLRPAIRWSSSAGATGYLIKLQSRVPEGPLLASYDVVVSDTLFVPPAALAQERAKVSVSVVARCGGGISAAASGWFVIDAGAVCPAPLALRVTREQGCSLAYWGAVPGAALYEVRLHAPLDGQVMKTLETREPRVFLDGALPHGAVVGVRARCAHGAGQVAIGVLAD